MAPAYRNVLEPLLPQLLENVLLDVHRIVFFYVRLSFYAFRHGALQYTNIIPNGVFFILAVRLFFFYYLFFFFNGDIPDVYLSPLPDISRARELEDDHLLTIQSACDRYLVFSTEYDSQLCVAVCCTLQSLVVALKSHFL
jgi:hypothetical protein